MPRLTAINPVNATGKSKQLLDGVQSKLGMAPNLMRTLAASPAALEAYLNFGASLSGGLLNAKLREAISIAVAQANSCEYCLSAHFALGKMAGLQPLEIARIRESHSEDPKRQAALQFVQALVVRRGEVSDATVEAVRKAGYSDGEIAEIVANVAINIFTNYFNLVAQTEVDFPRVSLTLDHAPSSA